MISPVLKAKGENGWKKNLVSRTVKLFLEQASPCFPSVGPTLDPCASVVRLRVFYLTLCTLHSKLERLVYIKQLIYVSILVGRTRRWVSLCDMWLCQLKTGQKKKKKRKQFRLLHMWVKTKKTRQIKQKWFKNAILHSVRNCEVRGRCYLHRNNEIFLMGWEVWADLKNWNKIQIRLLLSITLLS